jgi:hypothetical protein
VEIEMKREWIFWTIGILLSGCAPATPTLPSQPTLGAPSPVAAPTHTPAPESTPTSTPPTFTAIPTLPPAQTAIVPAFCADPQPVTLINSLKTSMLTADGALLSSLVHPSRGMDVRYFRDAEAIHYTPEQAKFLFETTFEAEWGNEPGSGLPKKGAFHDVVVPALVEVFSQPYTLHCNELKVGGATYIPEFPYDGNFYSVFFAGSDEFGQLDWHTWVIGLEYSSGKPYIIALMQFFWEP